MVKSVEFLKDWRCFKQGDKIELSPGINLLTGDQGCGKSSLLLMLKNDGFLLNDKIAVVDAPEGTASFYLDFEKGSIRDMDINVAAHRGISVGAVLGSMFVSHGEAVNIMLQNMPKQLGAVMLNDEPDMALSMRSIRNLYQLFVEHVNEYQQQIIVSCHNPYLMELVGELYSLEHRRTMPYTEFKQLMEK